jgi:DNA-binding transcriptional regulator YdaS (Cro superfamily)
MSDKSRPIEALISEFGGVVRLAERLGIDHSNVSKWRKSGRVPAAHRITIERLTDGRFRAVDL